MSDEGYKQAIENIAYEVDMLAEEVDQQPGSAVEKAISVMSGGEYAMLIEERARKLDKIIAVVADTYHRTDAEVDRDITEALQKRTQACPT